MRYALLLATAVLPLVAQDPYNEPPSYGRSRDFDLQHLKLDLSFDVPARKVMGTATLRLSPMAGDLHEIALDSAGLQVEGVTVAGRSARFRADGDKLYITLEGQYAAGASLDVAVRYHAQPKRGLFFIMPDQHHPNRPQQIWANGDTAGGNNRYWFPGYDFPNDKATTEMLVTVPAGWQAVSNGKLAGATENQQAGTKTLHWVQEQPMASYLVSLVAGEFDRREEKWKVPVEYYVPRGRASDVPRTFGRTIEMLDFFSANVAPYPWAKYAQAAVDTFGGGMENTSATTLAAAALLDPREFEDRRQGIDGLISHEMAHQWFGDLVTCADWRHTWLNEGFATYFAALWAEHAEGRDYFDWSLFNAAKGIVGSTLQVPVVPRDGQPTETAYAFIYNKGGWVLHMLRGQLGDARFWKAIQHYTKKFSFQTATTADFAEAVSEATGQDLEWLFDQFVYQPGQPDVDVAWDYDGASRLLHVSLKQKAPLFHMPVELEALGEGSAGGPAKSLNTFRVWVSKENEDLYFNVAERPRTVLFDPRDVLLKRAALHKPAAEWIWQMEHASRPLNRLEAADALGAMGTAETTAALERAGAADASFGVRLQAAASLGRIRTDRSRAALLKILADQDLAVRRTAAQALGGFKKDPDTIARLLDAARTDASFSVRQAALLAAAQTKPEKGVELIKPFLDMDSPGQVMRAAAVGALSSLEDDSLAPLMLELSHDANDRVRQSALGALATVGKGKQEITDRLVAALEDQEKGDRQTAVFALMTRKDRTAIPALQQLAGSEALPGIARAAHNAIEAVDAPKAPAKPPDELDTLRERLAELEKENKALKARLEKLENR
jgi:aminopeptidase N